MAKSFDLHERSSTDLSQQFRVLFEISFPLREVHFFANCSIDINVNQVGHFGSLDSLFECEGQNFWVMPEPPVINLLSSQSGTMDSRLLTGPDSDNLTILRIAYRIGLGVFKSNGREDQVSNSLCWQLLVRRVKEEKEQNKRMSFL